jgi:hypothetical protein
MVTLEGFLKLMSAEIIATIMTEIRPETLLQFLLEGQIFCADDGKSAIPFDEMLP